MRGQGSQDWSTRELKRHVNAFTFISQRVFMRLFCKSQFPHKSVNLFFTFAIIKDRLTDLCGN